MQHTNAQWQQQIDQAMQADRFRLRRLLQSISRAMAEGKASDRNQAQFEELLLKSMELRQRRAAQVPALRYDEELPVTARREDIAAAIREHQVVIVCGETGSGKSTQLPKICLEIGRGIDGFIGHTQPRRIAARSIAARLAEELGTPLGGAVGFKVRFADQTRPETYVKLMTDGILLAETQHDRFLDQYDTLIIDEAHERSLNIDFLLGYVKRLLPRRPDLRVIITSATIDAARFADHFAGPAGPAPVIEVSGRTYPVEVLYRPLEADEDSGEEPEMSDAILAAIDELARRGPGDMLVFLPTEREIREVAKLLRGRNIPGSPPGATEVLPLYARLSAAEQNKVFSAHKHRRIVLATNVAESSLTVPGIRFVVDTGTARISRYSPRSQIQRLPIEAVSQASADQRKGRCGRIGPGVCIRLFSENDYQNRDRYTTPEIRRTNLASVILQCLALNLGDIEEFPFLEPPKPENIRDGYRTLFELGAIDDKRRLTPLGKRLSRLPVDPRMGRIILAGEDEGCLHEILIIAAVLELQDPRERPVEKQQAADERHAQFLHPESDYLGYLKLWDFYHHLKETLSRNQLRKACQQNFLSYNRLREWQDIHLQLLRLTQEIGLKARSRRDDYAAIHRALLAGLLSGVAMRSDKHEYIGAGGTRFHLWPGAGPFGTRPAWIVAAELVETSRRYLRTIGRVEPEWIEPLAGHLVKRSYSEPHWSRRRGTVRAYERVSLFGLPLVVRRPVRYGPIDPVASRQLFIRHALVEGDCDLRVDFLRHNQQVVEEIKQWGAKTRRHDLVIDESAFYSFYDARIPADVYDVPTFQRWWKQKGRREEAQLRITPADLLGDDVEAVGEHDYPEQLSAGPLEMKLNYRFEPGAADDGVTLTVPREGLNHLHSEQIAWLVPGLLKEKIIALIRTLPKQQRRMLVPAPDTAAAAVGRLQFASGPFMSQLAEVLSNLGGIRIRPDDFRPEQLPDHLRMNIRVIDEANQTIAQARDLASVRSELGDVTPSGAEIHDSQWQADGLIDWTFGDLPDQVTVRRGSYTVTAFPAVLDRGKNVSLRLLDDAAAAQRQTRAGLRRLLLIKAGRDVESHVRKLPHLARLELYAATLPHKKSFRSQLAELLADKALFREGGLPRSAEAFEVAVRSAKRNMGLAAVDVAKIVTPLLENYHLVQVELAEAKSSAWREIVADIRAQLDELLPEDYLVNTPEPWLSHLPRFVKAILVRLEKLRNARLSRDLEAMQALGPWLDRCRERAKALEAQGIHDPALVHFRWMLEEYRVSLFAQELGTSLKVSPQRLAKQWDEVRP